MCRRDALKMALTGAAAVTAFRGTTVAARQVEIVVEAQNGDPQLPVESLRFDPDAVLSSVNGQTRAEFKPRIKDFARALVAEAVAHVGESRQTHRAAIERYLELFALPFESNGEVVPFCAAGLSYAATWLYARADGISSPSLAQLRNLLSDIDRHHFYPSPSVVDIKNVALGKRRWIGRAEAVGKLAPRQGWLVCFDWKRDGSPDHVGIVDRLEGTTIHTIEFNTSAQSNANGGAVARRERAFDATVHGFVRPELVKPV